MRYYWRTRFISLDGHVWMVRLEHIVDDGNNSSRFQGDLDIAADGIEIEWKETTRHDALCGSACTITAASKGYADFRDFYSVNPGDICLELWRDNKRYWRGVLDCETYSEPYDADSGYDVTMTFSDLGTLGRIKNNLTPGTLYSLQAIITAALNSASLPYNIEHYYGFYTGATYWRLNDISVDGANFYDEDGNPDSWADVLEYILQPLGLRIVQVPGDKFNVFDIPHLFGTYTRTVRWSATGQMLGVDRVYNRAKLSYSPYASAIAADAKIDYNKIKFFDTPKSVTWKTDLEADAPDGFTVEYGSVSAGNSFVGVGAASVAKLTSIYSGQDTAFLMAGAWLPQPGDKDWNEGRPSSGNGVYPWHYGDTPRAVFSAPTISLRGEVPLIKITLELLADGRYNPFESGNDSNCRGNYEFLQECRAAAVPVRIQLTAANGDIYVWDNNTGPGQWVKKTEGQAYGFRSWLTFYSWTRRGDKVIGGWIKNRDAAGMSPQNGGAKPGTPVSAAYLRPVPQRVLDILQRRGDGEFLTTPPVRGFLTVTVFEGIRVFDKNWVLIPEYYSWLHNLRWLCYRSLTIELCDKYGKALPDNDNIYSIELDTRHADELTLTTHCGSAADVLPTAKGLYIVGDGEPLRTISRGDTAGTVEGMELALIASQYASRSHVLRGEIYADDRTGAVFDIGRCVMCDTALRGVSFLPTAAVFHVLQGTVEATMVQIKPLTFNPEEVKTE